MATRPATRGIFGVVLLLRQSAAARAEVGIDRREGVARGEQRVDEHPVTGLAHDAHLGGVGLEHADLLEQPDEVLWGVLDRADRDHPPRRVGRAPPGEPLGEIDPDSESDLLGPVERDRKDTAPSRWVSPRGTTPLRASGPLITPLTIGVRGVGVGPDPRTLPTLTSTHRVRAALRRRQVSAGGRLAGCSA